MKKLIAMFIVLIAMVAILSVPATAQNAVYQKYTEMLTGGLVTTDSQVGTEVGDAYENTSVASYHMSPFRFPTEQKMKFVAVPDDIDNFEGITGTKWAKAVQEEVQARMKSVSRHSNFRVMENCNDFEDLLVFKIPLTLGEGIDTSSSSETLESNVDRDDRRRNEGDSLSNESESNSSTLRLYIEAQAKIIKIGKPGKGNEVIAQPVMDRGKSESHRLSGSNKSSHSSSENFSCRWFSKSRSSSSSQSSSFQRDAGFITKLRKHPMVQYIASQVVDAVTASLAQDYPDPRFRQSKPLPSGFTPDR